MKMMDDLYRAYDEMYAMETKYMSFREMRDYRELVRTAMRTKLMLALILLGVTVGIYLLLFLVCLFNGISFLMVDSVVMLMLGASCTVIASSFLNDRGRRTRKKMDDMYIHIEEDTP